MEREKYVKELAEFIGDQTYMYDDKMILELAELLYEEGYRKQSEGEWVYYECVSSYDGAKSGYACSECSAFVDEETFGMDEFHKKHCGNCGAKMKGGEG